MKTVLLAWELGTGLSHTNGLLVLARRFAEAGCRVLFAFATLDHGNPVLADAGFPVLQAPPARQAPHPSGQRPPAHSFASILAEHGFGDPAALRAGLRAWDTFLGFVKPDLLVADYAPFALLAAHGAMPTAAVSFGFAIPPPHLEKFPVLRPDAPPPMADDALLAQIAAAQRERRRPAPPRLAAITAGDLHIVRDLPEIDHYDGLRHGGMIGPIEPLAAPTPPPAQPSVYAYLRGNHADSRRYAEALARLTVPVAVHFQPPNAPLAAALRQRGITVHDVPPPADAAVAAASVVICHGGTGMVSHALAAGRPLVLLPISGETRDNAKRLAAAGYAEFADPLQPDFFPALVERVIDDRAMAARLAALGQDIAGRGYAGFADRAAAACLSLLR